MAGLRAGSPVRVGDVTLVPVARSGITSDSSAAGYWLRTFKEPYAVVVCDAGGIRALATDSSEIAVDALVRETPNLDAVLSGLSAS